MRLLGCYIENFGKLSDVSFSFGRGCNVVCRENGWGKSTLAAFICVMFYGFEEERSRDDLKNERKRYKPWQGGVYGGRLEFEANGETYVITRTFGAKEKDDRFELRKKETNLESSDYSERVGEEVFQLDRKSFCRTVFLSQNDCETEATDGINAKLGNLAEDTGDINNYESVNRMFSDLLNRMSPTRKTGSLNRMRDEIAGREETVRAGKGVERTMEEIRERIHGQLVRREELKAQRAVILERQKKAGAFKDIQSKQEKYAGLCEEYDERKRDAEEKRAYFPGRIPVQSELTEYIEESARLSAAEGTVNLYRLHDAERTRAGELEEFFGAEMPTEEELTLQGDRLRELGEIRLAVAERQLSPMEKETWDEYEIRFAQGVPDQQVLEDVISDWLSCGERKVALAQKQMKLEALRDAGWSAPQYASHRNAPRRGGMALPLCGAVFGAAVAAASLFFEGVVSAALLFLGILLATAGIGRCIFLGKASARERARSAEENDRILKLQEEIEEEEADIADIERGTAQFFADNGMRYSSASEVLESLYELKADIREYSALDRKRNLTRLRELEEKQKETVRLLETFFAKYYPGEDLKEEEFPKKLEEIKSSLREYESLREKKERFAKSVKTYGNASDSLREYVESLSMLPESDLHAQLMEIQRHLQIWNASMKEYEAAKGRKESFEETENMEKVLRARPSEDMEDMETLNGRLDDISQGLESCFEYIADYNRQLEGLQEEADRVAEEEEALEGLRNEYAAALKKYRLLDRTRSFLEQAKVSFTAKYTAPLRESFGKYYGMVSGEGDGRFHVDANSNVTVDEQGMQRSPKFFSAGYRDLIGVCMRMAMVETMYAQEKPFLVFDDPFANFDGEKLRGALRFLENISGEYQVLYFTCHESRAGSDG